MKTEKPGVYFNPKSDTYQAVGWLPGQKIQHIGCSTSFEEACSMRDNWNKENGKSVGEKSPRFLKEPFTGWYFKGK